MGHLLQHCFTTPVLTNNQANMSNIYETIDREDVHEVRRDGADRQLKHENSGEQLYSQVQVHASADGERGSQDYMAIRDEDEHSCSSPSSDDDDEAQGEEVVEVTMETQPTVEQAHDRSRRSSTSSDSSATPRDPCDDPPIQPRTQEEDNAEDVMLMAYTHPNTEPKPQESVDYGLETLENVTLDESSAAPADPSQPDISLFVKVRRSHLGLQARRRPETGL